MAIMSCMNEGKNKHAMWDCETLEMWMFNVYINSRYIIHSFVAHFGCSEIQQQQLKVYFVINENHIDGTTSRIIYI